MPGTPITNLLPTVEPGGKIVPANPHPGNDYYVDTLNGSIQRGYMAAQIRFVGHPIAGPFDWAEAVKVANASILNKDVIGPAKSAGSGIATVGQFLGKLNERQTWVRIAEGTLGLALILVALAHMTGIGTKTPVGRVLKIAKGVTHGSPKHAAPAPGPRSMPQGKHAKTGPNAPAQGKHAKP